ncbi:MAG: selenide, water dikinase SelD [Gammaproteobacteria bacterium]|nr:selenide, water dikinase SelD [Gammaproteobacteria bacterium]
MEAAKRLTELSHGGGCGCKIAPNLLSDMMRGMREKAVLPEALLVSTESSDDAAVYRLNEHQALIATTDFFMPIVDDPFTFGQIAATNALSDIYAMGGKPIMALALVAMPIGVLTLEQMRAIMEGGESVCRAAGIPVAGGHSIDSVEPIYGLAAMGLVHPNHLKRNNRAKVGDVLILGKPLGVGMFADALKRLVLSEQGYAQMIQSTTQLNVVGASLGEMSGVHAMTDVTGFGLLGHLAEVCRGSQVGAQLFWQQVPVWSQAIPLARSGIGPGAIGRNWASYRDEVYLADDIEDWQRRLLCDPQTSGGLLVSCAPSVATSVLETFHEAGFSQAGVIGQLVEGSGIRVSG